MSVILDNVVAEVDKVLTTIWRMTMGVKYMSVAVCGGSELRGRLGYQQTTRVVHHKPFTHPDCRCADLMDWSSWFWAEQEV